MIERDPHQVILEELRSYEQSPSDLLAVVGTHDALNRFIRPIKYKLGLPRGAKMATVRFLKERSIPGYQVHAIAFEDTAGLWWRLFCLVVQDPAGNWGVGGCKGFPLATATKALALRITSSRSLLAFTSRCTSRSSCSLIARKGSFWGCAIGLLLPFLPIVYHFRAPTGTQLLADPLVEIYRTFSS